MAPAPEPGRLPLASPSTLATLPAPQPGAGSLWRWGAAIPVAQNIGTALSLGEGGTPVVTVDGVHLKLEFLSPTGSFKDRGAVVLVAALVQQGAEAFIADSSGNAGSAIAAYAARAGVPCRVFVPADTSAAKQAQIEAYGATLERVDGDRTATAERALHAVQAGCAAYASHVYNPYFLQGTKTFAYELFEQLEGAPDAVVIPAGNGTLLLGAAIGFAELQAAGLIEHVPALVAVQSARCAPVARAWERHASSVEAVAGEPTLAEGIAIPAPARGTEMLAAVGSSGGRVVTVTEEEIATARVDLARRGFLVEPTAAAPWAALRRLRAAGELPGRVVVPLCGSGLKAASHTGVRPQSAVPMP